MQDRILCPWLQNVNCGLRQIALSKRRVHYYAVYSPLFIRDTPLTKIDHSFAEGERDISPYGIARVRAKQHINLLLIDTFAMMPFISVVEVLRLANRLSGEALYDWHCLSMDGEPAIACNEIPVPVDAKFSEAQACDTLIVCGPHEPYQFRDKAVFTWLRKMAVSGRMIGAVDTGTYLLARANLLNDYRCTLHWENIPGFVEEFPQLVVSRELFEVDRERLTCAGGTAAMDMMLQVVRDQHGQELAAEISDVLIHSGIRPSRDPQRMDLCFRTGINHPVVLEAIELMEANLEQPLLASELAEIVSVSKRQLERLFRRYLDITPSRHYLNLRLHRSQQLLQQTGLPVIDIAIACGFTSAGHFSQSFRALFEQSPREARRRVRQLW